MQLDGTELVIAGVSLIFTAVIAPLIRAAFGWLRTKTHSDALASALNEAQMVADNVVAGLEAGVVTAMKAKSEDGKLSVEEARAVAAMAGRQILRDLSQQTLAVIERNADDIGMYISNLIEGRLAKLSGKGGEA